MMHQILIFHLLIYFNALIVKMSKENDTTLYSIIFSGAPEGTGEIEMSRIGFVTASEQYTKVYCLHAGHGSHKNKDHGRPMTL
jgi:hypothetical protein